MKNICLVLVILWSFSIGSLSFAKNNEPVISTQGIELDESVAKSKVTQDVKTEQKQNKNRSKVYLKKKKQIAKKEFLKRKKQQELEYFEKRLENKRLKLESLTPNPEKGEKE